MIPADVLPILEALVKRFEGCRLKAYLDTGGVWTIGWGHTGPEVAPGLVWTQEKADTALMSDMDSHYSDLVRLSPILPGQLAARQAALVDFLYNLGSHRYDKSTLHRAVDHEDWASVKTQLALWVHDNGKVVPGLVARRDAEIDLIDA